MGRDQSVGSWQRAARRGECFFCALRAANCPLRRMTHDGSRMTNPQLLQLSIQMRQRGLQRTAARLAGRRLDVIHDVAAGELEGLAFLVALDVLRMPTRSRPHLARLDVL